MMNRIMGIDKKYDVNAKALGKAMQLINFVRDIAEDNELNRTYLPVEIRHGLADLKYDTVQKHPHAFKATMHSALAQYESWMEEAQPGLSALPRRCRIPVATAAAMYDWTARVIQKDPFVVFKRKVKPSKFRVLLQVVKQSFKKT
jgi:phytoene synthase